MLTNKEIVKQLKLTAALLELHQQEEFRIKAYTSAQFVLERIGEPIFGKNESELISCGFNKNMAAKLIELFNTNTLSTLQEWLNKTPDGVIKLLDIKGLGAKKIHSLWNELGIDSLDSLQKACLSGQIASLKGFGSKTQEQILEQIQFLKGTDGKLLFAKAEIFALKIKELIQNQFPNIRIEICGQLRRALEIIDTIEILVDDNFKKPIIELLKESDEIIYDEKNSNPFIFKGKITENQINLHIKFASEKQFVNTLFLSSAAPQHLALRKNDKKSLMEIAHYQYFKSEEEIYQAANFPYFVPELREGLFEERFLNATALPNLVEMKDLKGALHNHSTYSDGMHSLEQMAITCKSMGYEYLGISDHSKTAFYANGLSVERILQQHAEIDRLNQKLAPFKIFKGIESDILTDGSLDYEEDILKTFDFIVASIHGNLKMDKITATDRLLKAIANPYTTILGHPTGRLLLKREGYQIDYQAIIDACAAFGVAIEINANPQRLDLDWRQVRYALDKGVMISINPDAHRQEGYHDMRYGLLVGRKAALTAEQTLNTLTMNQIESWFDNKKKRHSA